MKIIIDHRASKDTFDALIELRYQIIKTPILESVYDAILGHPDIMFHKISDRIAVCEPTVYEYFKSKLPDYDIIKGNIALKDKYPDDIAYNVCALSDKVFCNVKKTEREILRRYTELGYEIINIKQGYAKCSICIVSENAIITSDMGIYKTAQKHDVDVLLVDDKNIKLPGMNHGFFGGATGLVNNKLLINGKIEKHPDCRQIIDFCKKYSVDVVSLNNSDIVDIGSIISVPEF